ncbi:hypothetical protein ABT124_03205 [Streptomyces sp. NPDC001982]|uniref:hypothetical protein n=1 Tax=Streptomyces sp. NPDC001982 TaxID=3154405 RepID=UPI003317E120
MAKGISPEIAAARMRIKFSGSRWRQIEAGYRKDLRREVVARPEVLAHMALVVGVSAERLEKADRADAAGILREIQAQEAEVSPPLPEALRAAPPHVRRMIEAALEDVDPEDRADVLREMAADYEAVMARRGTNPDNPGRPRRVG